MSHCVYETCEKCGGEYCARGCAYDHCTCGQPQPAPAESTEQRLNRRLEELSEEIKKLQDIVAKPRFYVQPAVLTQDKEKAPEVSPEGRIDECYYCKKPLAKCSCIPF